MSFERILQDNRRPLAVREGQTLQLCIAVVSGSLPYEELFTIAPISAIELKKRKKRGDAPAGTLLISIWIFKISL